MDRLTHSTGRPKHLEQNLNSLDVVTRNNNSTSASQEKITLPTLRNIAEKNGIKLYPFIQKNEYKYKNLLNSSETDSSSIVESSSSSDEDGELKKPTSEITLSSRPSSTQKKNSVTAFEVQSTSFFEHLPEDVIRKMLFEHVINWIHVWTTEKNLMAFAGVSKFNREFVRQLLAEDGMQGVSFEITKLVIPNLLAELAKGKKAEFTQADVDELIHDWPYLTLDCSFRKKTIFTNRGLQALKKIVCHPDLKGVSIINNLPDKISDDFNNFQTCINNGLELIYLMLSRNKHNPLKVDFETNNLLYPYDSSHQINETSFDLIKKIHDSPDNCSGLTFGHLWLRQYDHFFKPLFDIRDNRRSMRNNDYQFNCVKMMCNIALTHSVRSISLANLKLSDSELGLILNEIRLFDNSSLRYLYLSGNHIDEFVVESLSALLQSKNTCLKYLEFGHRDISVDALNILAAALKNNRSLVSVDINVSSLVADHPIRNDKRVKLSRAYSPWI